MNNQLKTSCIPAQGLHLFRPGIAVAFCASALSFFFCYARVAAALVQQWLSNDMYTHGFLIPFISLYLVWTKRQEFAKEPILPSYVAGGLLLGSGLGMLIFGRAAQSLTLQEISIPISLAGLISVLFGRRILALVRLPVLYLYFMIPVWSFLVEPLRPLYQQTTARLSSILMTFVGLPVHRNGTFLDLPNITLEVAPECSGIYYIIAIIAIGIPLAHLYLKSWTRRLVLLASSILIATLFNAIRIALIGWMAFHGISSVLHGPAHVLQSLSVTIVGYIALFGGVLLLSKKKTSPPQMPPEAMQQLPDHASGRNKNDSAARFWAATSVLACAGVFTLSQIGRSAPLKQSFDHFPNSIGQWAETQKEESFDAQQYIEPDVFLSRTYVSPEYGRVSLFIGYFEQQELKRKLVNYRIAGLNQHAEFRILDLGPRGRKKVNTVFAVVDGERVLLLFWYHISGKIIADSQSASLSTALNGLARGRQNGALVVISQPLADDAIAEQAVKNCSAFAKEIAQVIDQFVP